MDDTTAQPDYSDLELDPAFDDACLPPLRHHSLGPRSLDTLPLPENVETWARDLVRDVDAFRSGELYWEDVDHGVIVHGPPGTGKTAFAEALATSCQLPLVIGGFSVWSAAGHSVDLIQAMRATFGKARGIKGGCVVFIDEVDSFMARGRAHHNEGYFRPILNALLEELDGADQRVGVVVVAATNRIEDLDPALVRSGRLDRSLYLGLPNTALLKRIFGQHFPELQPTDWERAAYAAAGSSGADVERYGREARRVARRAGRDLHADDLMGILLPPDRRPASLRRRIATHEAGHALLALVEDPGALIHVSLRQSGDSGGGVQVRSLRGVDTDADVARVLRYMLAGRAAEQMVLGSVGTGSGGSVHSDLARATELAAAAELSLGLGSRLSWRGDPTAATLPGLLATHRDAADLVERRLSHAQKAAMAVISQHRGELGRLVEALLERGSLSGPEAQALFVEGKPRPREPLARIVGARR